MGVPQAETPNTLEAQPIDCSLCRRFTWAIGNFSSHGRKKLYSDIFAAGGYKWRILIFPKGNNVDHLSIYLDVVDSESLPNGWSRYAKFSLSIINQIDSKTTVKKETEHQFNASESDWGYSSFIPLSELNDTAGGFIMKDTCVVEAEVRLNEEQYNKELKIEDEAEAHQHTVIKVARNEDLIEQIGKDIYFDLVDHDKVHRFCIRKEEPFYKFKEKVAKEFGIPVQSQRFWLWAKRQNHTFRPFKLLTSSKEVRPVGQLRGVSDKANDKELKLFLEVEHDLNLLPVVPPERTREDILLFFKLYDPLKEELRYVGRLYANRSGKAVEMLTKLKRMARFNHDEEIELYEEIQFEPSVMCIPIDKEITLHASELGDGDIICFQKSQVGISKQCRYPDVPSFLEYVRKRQELSVEAHGEQSKSIGLQTVGPDTGESTLPPALVNLPQEQSISMTSGSTDIKEQSEQVAHVAETDVFPCTEGSLDHSFLVKKDHVCSLSLPKTEEETLSAKQAKMTITPSGSVVDQPSVNPPQEPIDVEDESDNRYVSPTSSFAEFDKLLADIWNLLQGETVEAHASSSFEQPQLSDEDICQAKETFRQCLDTKLSHIIQLGRASGLKNSLSIMLIVNAFPDNMVRDMTKFLANFDQSCEQFMAAQQELQEAQQKEYSVSVLKTVLKQVSFEFVPLRNRITEVDREAAELERQLAERKEEKAQLRNYLEQLALQATSSRNALINAEQDTKLFVLKKEQAKKMVADIERSWDSLKADCSKFFH